MPWAMPRNAGKMYSTSSPTSRLRSSLAGGASRSAASNRAAFQPLASLPQRPDWPVLPRPVPLVQILEELLIAKPLPVLHGILEDLVGQVDAGQRGIGMKLP